MWNDYAAIICLFHFPHRITAISHWIKSVYCVIYGNHFRTIYNNNNGCVLCWPKSIWILVEFFPYAFVAVVDKSTFTLAFILFYQMTSDFMFHVSILVHCNDSTEVGGAGGTWLLLLLLQNYTNGVYTFALCMSKFLIAMCVCVLCTHTWCQQQYPDKDLHSSIACKALYVSSWNAAFKLHCIRCLKCLKYMQFVFHFSSVTL